MAEYEDKEQKTEEATPRRREEARDKGQVALSSELMAGIGLCVGFAMLALGGGHLMRVAAAGTVTTLSTLGELGTIELSVPLAAALVTESITSVMGALALVMVPPVVLGGLVGYMQVGLRFTSKAVELDPSKINPVQGMKRLFGARAVVRTLMSGVKVTLITLTVAVIAWSHVGEVVVVSTNELGPMLVALGHIALRCTLGALVVIVALSLVDLLFQRFRWMDEDRTAN